MSVASRTNASFAGIRAHGLWGEIDLHAMPSGQVWVAHDRPRMKKVAPWAQTYLEENRLSKVIEIFAERRYFERGKLYLEIKASKRMSPEETARIIEAAIHEGLDNVPADLHEEVRRALGFVSFSFEALEACTLHLRRPRSS